MTACTCPEKHEPLKAYEGRPGRLWRVVNRHCNYSAFNGYRRTLSSYSLLACLRCGAHWRTKGEYVHELKDRTGEEQFIGPDYDGYAEAMVALGRPRERP